MVKLSSETTNSSLKDVDGMQNMGDTVPIVHTIIKYIGGKTRESGKLLATKFWYFGVNFGNWHRYFSFLYMKI